MFGKQRIEHALGHENKEMSAGRLKDENPLDSSAEFRQFCEACRRGDLKACQEAISRGININARDAFDYTPLILASLCGHYEVAQMLLEQGALCERDAFQGERCLYNALNERIRKLLLQYAYSKSTHPLQPWAAHVTSLLTRGSPQTADITVQAGDGRLELHKFVLAARSPYFAHQLSAAPETTHWQLPDTIAPRVLETCVRYLYMGDVGADAADGDEAPPILPGVHQLGRQWEIPQLFQLILPSGDRRQARQRRQDELSRGRDQLAAWFTANVLRNKMVVDSDKADGVRWHRHNRIFADVLLRADEPDEAGDWKEIAIEADGRKRPTEGGPLHGVPARHFPAQTSPSPSRPGNARRSVLFPCHRAMLLRSDVFDTMFASPFREGQDSKHLHIVPVDCSPEVLEIVLTFLYADTADFPLAIALEVLRAADMLFIERLKQRAALLISTLGHGGAGGVDAQNRRGDADVDDEVINIYDVLRAGWETRVQRLEAFAARFLADRLEQYIDEAEFHELVKESAARVTARQETDTVELVDDIRYYLGERFRLRFEDAGLDEMMKGSLDPPECAGDRKPDDDEGVDVSSGATPPRETPSVDLERREGEGGGIVRTLDGDVAGDEFLQDAQNYRILLGKLDTMMERLGLDG